MLLDILNFLESNITEIMTLLGVLVGAVVGFLGQIFAIKMNNAENVRKERTATAKMIYSHSDSLFNELSQINVIMPHLGDESEHLKRFYKKSDTALEQFDSYYTKNRIGIPVSSEKLVTELHQSAIHLVLEVERIVGVMQQSDIEQELLASMSTDWRKGFQEFKELHGCTKDVLRGVVEGSIRK